MLSLFKKEDKEEKEEDDFIQVIYCTCEILLFVYPSLLLDPTVVPWQRWQLNIQ